MGAKSRYGNGVSKIITSAPLKLFSGRHKKTRRSEVFDINIAKQKITSSQVESVLSESDDVRSRLS